MKTLRTVEDYLASIPGGIDGYPDCLHKGEPFAAWLEHSPTKRLPEYVPQQAARWLATDNVPTWVPEVHTTVTYLALREAYFPSDAAFLEHARVCNQAVLDTPVNRVLFWAASPRAILRGGALRWGTLHRGSSMSIRTPDDRSAELTLEFPPKLLPEIVLRGNAVGITLALERTGGRGVEVLLRSVTDTRAVFEARWR
jgi:hypothetical protein